jgi:hypothetical protein
MSSVLDLIVFSFYLSLDAFCDFDADVRYSRQLLLARTLDVRQLSVAYLE